MALQAHWKLNEPTAGNDAANAIIDYSGNGYHGSVGGGSELTSVVDPVVPSGKGLAFDGATSYITAVNQIIPSQNYPFSISGWAKKSTDSGGVIVGISKTGRDSTLDIRHIAGRAAMRTKDQTGSTATLEPRVSALDELNYPLNEYHFIVGVFEDHNIRKIYMHGQFYKQDIVTGPIIDAPIDWMIGAKQAAGAVNTFTLAELSDIRIYNHTLTDLEIWSMYDSILIYLKLNEFTGVTGVGSILDSSGNGLVGTPENTVISVTAPVGRGILFNGSSDAVIIPAPTNGTTNGNITGYPFSMSCWYSTSTAHTGYIILANVSGQQRAFGLRHAVNGVNLYSRGNVGGPVQQPSMMAAIFNG